MKEKSLFDVLVKSTKYILDAVEKSDAVEADTFKQNEILDSVYLIKNIFATHFKNNPQIAQIDPEFVAALAKVNNTLCQLKSKWDLHPQITKYQTLEMRIGKLVTSSHNDITLWSDGIIDDAVICHLVDQIFYGEVAIVISQSRKARKIGWVQLLNTRDKIGYARCFDLKSIT